MIKKNLFLVLMGIVISISSCKKDKNEDPIDSAFDAQYSEASADENKSTIEDNGIALSQEMSDMKELDAIQVVINFGSMMGDNGLPVESAAMSKGLTPISILKSFNNGTTSAKSFSDGLKSVTADPENLAEAWDMIVGTYEYNFITEEFDKIEEGGNEVVILFPGVEGDITNTGEIKINDFNYKEVTEPFITNDEEDISLVGQQLPTSIHTQLSYEGDVLITWDFSASYENNGMPTSFNSKLTVEPYSISVSLTHDPYSNATTKFSFKNGSTILLETFAEANGDWSESNINDNVETETIEGDYYTETYTTVYVENIVNNANAYFQLLNIKIAGMVDFKAIVPAVRDIEDKYDAEEISDQEYTEQMVDLINKNAKLVVVTADKNELMAKVELYPYYDDEDGYWDASVKFIFGDGSEIDAETYMANGDYKDDFGDLIDEINQMINDFNYDYDTDVPNVE